MFIRGLRVKVRELKKDLGGAGAARSSLWEGVEEGTRLLTCSPWVIPDITTIEFISLVIPSYNQAYKSPKCTYKSPNSPNSGYATYFVVTSGFATNK